MGDVVAASEVEKLAMEVAPSVEEISERIDQQLEHHQRASQEFLGDFVARGAELGAQFKALKVHLKRGYFHEYVRNRWHLERWTVANYMRLHTAVEEGLGNALQEAGTVRAAFSLVRDYFGSESLGSREVRLLREPTEAASMEDTPDDVERALGSLLAAARGKLKRTKGGDYQLVYTRPLAPGEVWQGQVKFTYRVTAAETRTRKKREVG